MLTRRFVVQRHTQAEGSVHYDLMVEDGEVLVTFQLEDPPGREGSQGTRSFDHRPVYLTYQGEISGGRGSVEIWDRGQLRDVAGHPRESRYRARFAGERLSGLWELREEAERVRLAPVEASA